ncbi:MAG: peptide chain release factor-like protein [Candidatus Hydrogenedentes bacterium]|nr:peptide chain release factor-like protein [Candidatus Hydrogenedentota bacterium]
MSRFGVSPGKEQELLNRMEQVGLREDDLDESFVRSGGKGGQKVNKTSSCVQLKHRPSGLEVKMQQERSQALNRFFARRRLCELLEEELLGKDSPEALRREKLRKQKARRKRRGTSGGEETPGTD